ncbi:hypothetical protein Tco_0560484 [Tanacetum coccineum]
MNIELEHSVAKLCKENETLKKNYKYLYDSIKITRSKTIEQTTSLLDNNADLKAQIQEKVFGIAALKNDLRKLKGNSVDTNFDNTSVLGKPILQSPRNQSVVRQPNAFKSERPQMNSSKNMPRFSSNDMVHNHYLDEAKKKTQERDRNSNTSVTNSARFQSTADDSKPKPMSNNQTLRSLHVETTGRIFKSVGLRCIPTRKLFDSCTSKVDSEPSYGSNVDIPNIHECKQTLDFWQTATVITLDNGEMKIIATIDGKVKIVTEASIRRHLKLEDSDGISNFPTTEIFELALMGRTTRQESMVPQPRYPTQTNVADEAASTGVDVRHGGAATTVTSLDAGQGSVNIDKTPSMPNDSPLPRVHTFGSNEGRMQHNELMDLVTKLSDRVVKKLEKTVKTRQARRKARIVVSDDEEDLEDPSKQGRKIAKIDQDPDISLVQHDAEPVSTAGASVSTAGASSVKDKGKAIMEEAETIQTRTKLQLEQERLGYEEALRLQAEIDEKERQRIIRVQEEASSLNIEEWDDIQARVEADEEFAHRL